MATLAWPSVINPSRFSFGQRNNCRVHVSPLSGSVQTIALPGSRWTASMQWDRMRAADRGMLMALLAQLRGQANDIALYDLAVPQPRASGWANQAPSATNFLLQSVDFANAVWQKNGANIAGSITDPELGTSAQSLTGTLADSYTFQQFMPASVAQRNFSIWLKAPTLFTLNVYATRNAPFGTAGSASWNITTAWQRFSFAFSPLDTTLHALQIGGGNSIGVGRVLHLWGPQIELGSTPTPYINTGVSTATRPSGVSLWGGVAAGASFLILRGFNIGVEALLPGDKFTIGGELKMVTAVSANGTTGVYGHVGVNFEPPLRAAVADGSAITLDKPTARFMLANPDWGMDMVGQFPDSASLELDLVEVF